MFLFSVFSVSGILLVVLPQEHYGYLCLTQYTAYTVQSIFNMLILELSVVPKNVLKSMNMQPNSWRLTQIFQATHITAVSKHARSINTSNPDSSHEVGSASVWRMKDEANRTEITNIPLEKGKRPRGRPRKMVSLDGSSGQLRETGNTLDKFQDTNTYLEYASYKKLKTTSTVFVGNLYELEVKKFLKNQFQIQSTLHQGGSNDKGIDINAIWNPTKILKAEKSSAKGKSLNDESSNKFEIVNSKKIKPLAQRANQTLKLFVQCKCFDTSKIDPKIIREIKGSSQEYFKKNGNSAVFMIASTNGFTKVGKEDFDKATIPMIFLKFPKPKLVDLKYPYKLKSWEMGTLEGVYMNSFASALFKGLDWIKFVNKLKASCM